MNQHYQFSAPGRTEIGGNHTDHQHGCVLAAAINLETVADVTLNGTDKIYVQSEGYPSFYVDLTDLQVHKEEVNTTAALVRGVVAAFVERGAQIKGFDMAVSSNVLPGSGLSSSAAFEVLIGTICNELFFEKKLNAVEIAQIGQYAENVYFGKPCGLMDQTASSVGSMVFIDFNETQQPKVEKIDFDFQKAGYDLCIIDSGADHADLTDEYAAITRELKALCAFFGKEYLRQIPEFDFMAALPELRKQVSDRAILRAMHVYRENERVVSQAMALKAGAVDNQPVAYALSLCDTLLRGRGAYRVHGGGFAGTVQAFVPHDMLETFKQTIEANLGEGSCHVLNVRPYGGIRIQ